ncbi:dihydroneopterin aldolase [Candidatus Woesearchaeota archaeon]|nr:dihydroneopterin aldolase [Candidatus Woesearchaeota archaeon]
MDRIIISDAEFSCIIGVGEAERSCRQPLFLDMELWMDLSKAAVSDSIKDTINYSTVCKKVGERIEGKSYKLIESVAEDAAQVILSDSKVFKARVLVKKPSAIKCAKHAAVEITRENSLA